MSDRIFESSSLAKLSLLPLFLFMGIACSSWWWVPQNARAILTSQVATGNRSYIAAAVSRRSFGYESWVESSWTRFGVKIPRSLLCESVEFVMEKVLRARIRTMPSSLTLVIMNSWNRNSIRDCTQPTFVPLSANMQGIMWCCSTCGINSGKTNLLLESWR